MAYINYTYYTTQGGAMPEGSFNKIVGPASDFIDRITFHRIRTVDENVKRATVAVCEEMYKFENATVDGVAVKSASNDGFSVTYADGVVTKGGQNNILANAAATFLAHTGLMDMVI